MGPYWKITDNELERTIKINAIQVSHTIKVLAGQMLERYDKRGKMSGLIITSSISAVYPYAGTLTYAASKAFASAIGKGLHHEFRNKIDVLVYHAANVRTKM